MDKNATKRLRYKKRKEAGLCVYCGKVAIQGLIVCEYHRELRKKYTSKYINKESVKERRSEQQKKTKKKLYDFRVKNKLCTHCGDPVDPGTTMCVKHLYERAKAMQDYKRRNLQKIKEYHDKRTAYRRQNRLCLSCGTKLNEEWDVGHVTCINCREGIRPELQRRYV